MSARTHSLAIEAVLLVALVAAAIGMRLVNLDQYSGLFDEGIRGEQLFLMTLGYRPFRDIFAAQGPLLLDSLYPWFRLYGSDLAAARLAVGTYSMLGLLGIYLVARSVGGPLAALAAATFVLLSPLYLEGSRLALAEVPAMAPAILAVACGLRYAGTGSRRWLVAAGGLLAVGLMMKPIVLAAGVPLGLLILGRWRAGCRRVFVDLVILGATVGVISVAAIALVGLGGVLEQIVGYRRAATASDTGNIWKNRVALARGLSFEPTAVFAIALIGTVLAAVARCWTWLVVSSWAIASLALLLLYSPLHGKHMVVAIPPIAAAAGLGTAGLVRLAREQRGTSLRLATLVTGVVLLVWLASSLPQLAAQSGTLLRVTADTDIDPALEQYADAVATIEGLTSPGDFIVTDQPYLAFLARRPVPPWLVDTSKTRIDARYLRGGETVEIASRYDPRLVILWNDRLRALQPFVAWVEQNFRLVKVYNRRQDLDRGLYMRREGISAGTRDRLRGRASTSSPVDFGGDLRLSSSSIGRSEIRSGEGAAVTLEWELLRQTTVDYHAIVAMRGADGQVWDQQQESLAGGSVGTARWEPGRWLYQSTFVRADRRVPPGDYAVHVSVYDSRARRLVATVDGATDVRIGDVRVR
jgi:hypothetical protein